MSFERNFSVHFSDVDKNNILKPSALLNYLQEIGSLHTDSVKLGLYQVPILHFAWIVLGWKIKINSLPKWNDQLRVVTWPRSFNNFFYFRDYEIYNNKDEKIACATSKWICFDTENQRIEKVSEKVTSLLPTDGTTIFDEKFGKMKEPLSYENTFFYTILKHDIDTNNHLNNVKYLTLALEVLPDSVSSTDISEIEIMYKNSSYLHEDIVCLYHKETEKEHIVTIKSKDQTILHSILKFTLKDRKQYETSYFHSMK